MDTCVLWRKVSRILDERKPLERGVMKSSISECWGGRSGHCVRVLCIQGPSASGKTTLASRVERIFRRAKEPFFTLHMDEYYKSLSISRSSERSYDFDNPGAIDWEKIFKVVDGIHNEDDALELFEYSYRTRTSTGPIFYKNPKPKYVIIEGVYAFFTFTRRFFDLACYDPHRKNEENAEGFVANVRSYPRFSVFNVLLTTCREKMLKVRIRRDVQERGKCVEGVHEQVLEHAWPATLRWVYSGEVTPHFVIDHGTFNEKRTAELVRELEIHVSNSPSAGFCSESYVCEFCGPRQ